MNPLDRMLEIVFGKKLQGEDAERARAEGPPRWVRHIISGLYLVWFLLFTLWGLGKLGWLPEARETFTLGWLMGLNGYGLVVQWASYGLDRHYRMKARRKVKSVVVE